MQCPTSDYDFDNFMTISTFHEHDDFAKILVILQAEESDMGVSIQQPGPTSSYIAKKSLLAQAVEHGKQKAVKILLENGANVQEKLNDSTLLSYAVTHDNLAIAKLLLEFGADVDASADDGKTPLILALIDQNAPLVELLLAHGANYRHECANGIMTLIHAVGKSEDVSCLNLLLTHVEARDGRAALCEYVNAAHLKVDDTTNHMSSLSELGNKRTQKNESFSANVTGIKCKANELIEEYTTVVGSPYKLRGEIASLMEQTALAIAVSLGHVMTAKVLLENGANVNDILGHGLKKSPLLHYATIYGNVSMTTLLLDFGADVNVIAAEFDGSTPLVFALICQNVQMVELLLAHGADYRHVCASGIMTLVYAVFESDDVQCLKLLLEHVEAREGRAALVEYVNFDSPGVGAFCAFTVLMTACALARYNCIKLLLAMGADATKRDLSDRPPYAYIPREDFVKRGRILLFPKKIWLSAFFTQ